MGKEIALAWRLMFWLVIVAIAIIRYIWVVRSKRLHEVHEDRATNDLVERARTLGAVPIAKLPEGQVARAIGEVRALETLAAPLDKRPCVSWRVMVSVLSPADGAHWELVSEHEEGTPFVLADATGECQVDPSTAAFGLQGGRARTFKRGQALPSDVASYCVARGLSLDDLRSKSIYITEQLLPVGARVSIAGIGQRVARAHHGERDYRASEPTWIAMDARTVDLLISNASSLLKDKATRAGDVEWPGTKHARGEAIGDDFEDKIISQRRRRQRIMMIVPIAIVVGLGVVLLAGQLGKQGPPDVMTDAQYSELMGMVNPHRIAAYRADDAWRASMAERRNTASTGTCEGARVFPVTTMSKGDELPLQSARTTEILADVEAMEARIKAAKGSEYATVKAQIEKMTFPPYSVLVERNYDEKTSSAYMYDHMKHAIVCTVRDVEAAKVLDVLERGQ